MKINQFSTELNRYHFFFTFYRTDWIANHLEMVYEYLCFRSTWNAFAIYDSVHLVYICLRSSFTDSAATMFGFFLFIYLLQKKKNTKSSIDAISTDSCCGGIKHFHPSVFNPKGKKISTNHNLESFLAHKYEMVYICACATPVFLVIT